MFKVKELTPATDMVMAMLTDYSNLSASPNTPQYGFRKGMEIFEEDEYEAPVSKLKDNIVGRGCVNMLGKKEITGEICNKALAYLMFLKRKRTGKVKNRGCADRRPQREYVSKEDSSLPTVSIYALMAQYMMNSMEGRKVVTCDILGVFLQLDWLEDDDCYIKFEGLMMDMLCRIDPAYKKKVLYTRDGRKKYLYGKLTKAVYGTILGSILFYNKLSKQLED